MNTIRVLVFGATGSGKTSLCNTLTGQSRPTDDGAVGVTGKSHKAIADLAIKHIPELVGEMANKIPVPGVGTIAKTLSAKILRKVTSR